MLLMLGENIHSTRKSYILRNIENVNLDYEFMTAHNTAQNQNKKVL
jgi:hypothetical protein